MSKAKLLKQLFLETQQRFGQEVPKALQGPLPKARQAVQGIGGEDAAFIREGNQNFPRMVDQPEANTSKDLLRQMQERQQMLMQDASQQLNTMSTPTITPDPEKLVLSFKNGTAITTTAGAAALALSLQGDQFVGEPATNDVPSPSLAVDEPGPEPEVETEQPVSEVNTPEPVEPELDEVQPAVAPELGTSSSEPLSEKERINQEYDKLRSALGDNPSQADMDAVRDAGLQMHKDYFNL
tara:strand:- start:75 stop:791 length:717 start_codon:yes stop_codon:yes gene_type:complete